MERKEATMVSLRGRATAGAKEAGDVSSKIPGA